jgi:hypothetical protein
MPSSKLALASGLAAIVLCGCGQAASPPRGRGQVDSQVTLPSNQNHLACLRNDHLQAQQLGRYGIQIGVPPSGPQVWYTPTPGVAQGQQIQGIPSAQGAEVIGAAQVYPNGASDNEMKKVELCISQGVSG